MAGMESMWRPPRSCNDYWSEYKHCKSLMNRFHHYYTFGKSPSCKQWKTDYYTCVDWERHQDTAAKDALRQSERARLAQQRQHDPVWKLRKTPPSDWHLPLHHGSPKDS